MMALPGWVNPTINFYGGSAQTEAGSVPDYYYATFYYDKKGVSSDSRNSRAKNALGGFTSYFDDYQNRYNEQADAFNSQVSREAGELSDLGSRIGRMSIADLYGGTSGQAYQNLFGSNGLGGVDFNIAGPTLDPTSTTTFGTRYGSKGRFGGVNWSNLQKTTKQANNTALADTSQYGDQLNDLRYDLQDLGYQRNMFDNRYNSYMGAVGSKLGSYLGAADNASVASSNLSDLISGLNNYSFGYQDFAGQYGYSGDPYKLAFDQQGGIGNYQTQQQQAIARLNNLLNQQQAFTGKYNSYANQLNTGVNSVNSLADRLTIADAPSQVTNAINQAQGIQNAAGYTPFMSSSGYNPNDQAYRTLFYNLGGLSGVNVNNALNTLNDVASRREYERQAATMADTSPFGFSSRADEIIGDIASDDLRYNLFELEDAERRRQQLRSDLGAYQVLDRFGNDVTSAVVGDILDPRSAALDAAYNGQSAQQRIAALQSQRDAELAAILSSGQDLAGRVDAADITDETLLQSLDQELASIRSQLDPYSGGNVTLSGGGKDLLIGEGASQDFLLSPTAQRLTQLLRTRGASAQEIAALMAQFESRLTNLGSQTPDTQVYSNSILSGLESQANRLGYDLSNPGLKDALSDDAYALIGTAGYEDPTAQYRSQLDPMASVISGYRDTRNSVMDQAQALIDSYGGRLDAMTIEDKQQLDALMAELQAQQAAVQPYTGGRASDILGSQGAGLYGAQSDVREVLNRRANQIALAEAERERMMYGADALNSQLQQDGLIYNLGMMDELEAQRQALRDGMSSYSILDRFGNQLDTLTDDNGNIVNDFSAVGNALDSAYALGDGSYQSAAQRLNALREQRQNNINALASSGMSAETGLADVALYDEAEFRRRAALAANAATGLARYTGGQAVQDYLQGNDAAFNEASAAIQSAAALVDEQLSALSAKRDEIAQRVQALNEQLQEQRFYIMSDVAGKEPTAEQMSAEVDLYNAQSALSDMVAAEQRLAQERSRIQADMQAVIARQRAMAEAHAAAQVTPITDVRAQQYSLVDPLTQDVTAYLAAVSGKDDDRRRGISRRTFRRSLGR